jgi:hypothetical protein
VKSVTGMLKAAMNATFTPIRAAELLALTPFVAVATFAPIYVALALALILPPVSVSAPFFGLAGSQAWSECCARGSFGAIPPASTHAAVDGRARACPCGL